MSTSYGVIACLLLRLDKAGVQWQSVGDLCADLQLPVDSARANLEQLFVDGLVRVKRHHATGEIEAAMSALVGEEQQCA